MNTQNDLLLNKLLEYYKLNNNLDKMLSIINGQSNISLRIVDWFATNYAKKNYTVYEIEKNRKFERFKVYVDYKLHLKAYSKKRFDPFCRWERITIPYNENNSVETTIGQLNFFRWALENKVIDYIQDHYDEIDKDMNTRNSTSKVKNYSLSSNTSTESNDSNDSSFSYGYNNNTKTRKKREELSCNASKSIKKESVDIVLDFN
jgi:hypothetical protein